MKCDTIGEEEENFDKVNLQDRKEVVVSIKKKKTSNFSLNSEVNKKKSRLKAGLKNNATISAETSAGN